MRVIGYAFLFFTDVAFAPFLIYTHPAGGGNSENRLLDVVTEGSCITPVGEGRFGGPGGHVCWFLGHGGC